MKISFDSPIILIFSFLCTGVYLLTAQLNLFTDLFVLMPEWNFSSPTWYFRLFSHTLGHSSMDHLIGNLAFILLLGPIVESRYGGKKLLLMILATALTTALSHLLFFNHGLMGASGIVFMLIILVSLSNFKNKTIPLTFILIVIIFIGREFIGTFQEDNISHFAHIIGGATGAVFGFLLSGHKTNLSAAATDRRIV